jgi:2,4'-dihydroxyacetophenone dioxygenase
MDKALTDTLEKLIHTPDVDAGDWITFPEYGFRQLYLWKDEQTRGTIALLDFEKGGRIPVKHTHASNQFMYCLQGEYEYTDTALRLVPGSFYMNPKDHPHGPTLAHSRCLLLEIYDGPHYYEKPSFHTDETIGDQLAKPGSSTWTETIDV